MEEKGSNSCAVQQGAPEEARPPNGLPHAAVEAWVVATAAFLICGRRLMWVFPGAVFRRQDEGTGSGHWRWITICKERYGGPCGQTEHRRRAVWGLDVLLALWRDRTRRVTERTGGHGERHAGRVLLRMTLGGDLLAVYSSSTQLTLQVVLYRRCAGDYGCRAEAWHGRHRSAVSNGVRNGGIQVDSNVPNVYG